MTKESGTSNRIRQHRVRLGLTQAELAERAGISRSAITAIEGSRLVTSVTAAIAIAGALGTSVEALFGNDQSSSDQEEVWAWKPATPTSQVWRADVSGRTVIYPASMKPMLTLPPDVCRGPGKTSSGDLPAKTLVMACCDPAAGILARHFAVQTGMRLIVLPRSSRDALGLLKEGLVHLAGVHFSTREAPERNDELIRTELGNGFCSIRIVRWQEGIVFRPSSRIRSVNAAVNAQLTWVGRETGSGARKCLDQILKPRSVPRQIARDHSGVVEAVKAGWADAGVCVELVGAEAGLEFLPVQEEALDVCFPSSLADDHRMTSFVNVVRSASYRSLIGELPGFDASETGNVWSIN
jgi:putative molybdopterin biosynthesis protein